MPCRRWYWPRYHSAAAFDVPYGESGAIGAVSGVGMLLRIAVDRGGGGHQHPPRAGLARRLQHRDGARHVDLGVERRVGDRLADVDLRGEVHDDVGPRRLERPPQRGEVAHVGGVQLHAAL